MTSMALLGFMGASMAGIIKVIKLRSQPVGLTDRAHRVRHLRVPDSTSYLSAHGLNGTLLKVRASPGAKKNLIDGIHGEALRIRVAAPPVDGKANKALVAFLAKALGIPRKRVTLSKGEKSRDKTFAIEGLLPGEVAALLG